VKKIVLLLGGARSGKSRLAQEMAKGTGNKVLFVATGTAGDEDMHQRIAMHKQDRPVEWRTLEAPLNIGKQITANLGDAQTVIIDCITLLVSNVFCRYTEEQFGEIPDTDLDAEINLEINGILDCLQKTEATFFLVSNEVGLGIVPDNRMARLYRDSLGRANQVLAQSADEVYFLVAGIPIRIKPHHL
jgi:adenosylcobinamide kinase/adenosylcobinamide-phosphate guanylyltransferase